MSKVNLKEGNLRGMLWLKDSWIKKVNNSSDPATSEI